MKRSSKVMLLFMGTAAAGNISAAPALALIGNPCEPRPGVFMPDYDTRCMTRGGFGGSAHRFAGHAHGHGHGHGG
jgi:hypothetical protein